MPLTPNTASWIAKHEAQAAERAAILGPRNTETTPALQAALDEISAHSWVGSPLGDMTIIEAWNEEIFQSRSAEMQRDLADEPSPSSIDYEAQFAVVFGKVA